MKKKLIIFDLDGVLFDTKKNMELSWNSVKKKYNLDISFNNYFKLIGQPFYTILKNLGINIYKKKIFTDYNYFSIKYQNEIKLYKGVKKVIEKLKKKNFIAVVTSKNKKRTFLLLKKYCLNFHLVSTPNKRLKGKPHPDQINFVIKNLGAKKKNTVYIGDTQIDCNAAKKAKIDFIFAKYGYGKIKNPSKFKKISSIKNILNHYI